VSGADDGGRGGTNTVDEELGAGSVENRPGSDAVAAPEDTEDAATPKVARDPDQLPPKAMDYASMDRLESASGEAATTADSESRGASGLEEWDWLDDTEPGEGPLGESIAIAGDGLAQRVRTGDELDVVQAESEESIFQEGQAFDRYELQARLGSGAFAEVWRAVETGSLGFSKQVALKILKPGRMDRETRDALIHEARVCGMLHHPHLVDVYGVGETQGTAYIAMEHVEGITLSVLRKRLAAVGMRLPTSVLLDLGIQLCEGLDYAHSATDHEGSPLHLVHRDLKPGNIMLSWTSGVKIADFGLAKATTSDQTTQAGILRGTPGYIAPEVWTGSRDFQPTVDLFAVGVMLWELAVGDSLFKGPLHPLINTVLNRPVEEEIQRLQNYVPSLAEVVGGCLQRDPALRIQTAWELVEKLQVLRNAVRAPGGLELFLSLVRSVADPKGAQEGSTRIPVVTESTDPEWLSALELATFQSGGFIPSEGLATANFERWGMVTAAEVGSTRDMTVADPDTVVAPGVQGMEAQPLSEASELETHRRPPQRSDGYSMGWLVAGSAVLALGVVVGGLFLLQVAGVFNSEADVRGSNEPETDASSAIEAGSQAREAPSPRLRGESAEPAGASLPESPPSAGENPPDMASPSKSSTPPASQDSPLAADSPALLPSKAPAKAEELAATSARRPRTKAARPSKPAVGAVVGQDGNDEEAPQELGPGCVVLRSNPPGARVKLDGRDLGLVGSQVHSLSGKTAMVEMNSAGAPVTYEVGVEPGQKVEVTCDVSFPEAGRTGCKTKLLLAGCP